MIIVGIAPSNEYARRHNLYVHPVLSKNPGNKIPLGTKFRQDSAGRFANNIGHFIKGSYTMGSYDTKVGDHTVTINYLRGGTNQVGVKKPAKVKAWALCPVSGKKIEEASESVGEATRAVERGIQESIDAAAAAAEAQEPVAVSG